MQMRHIKDAKKTKKKIGKIRMKRSEPDLTDEEQPLNLEPIPSDLTLADAPVDPAPNPNPQTMYFLVFGLILLIRQFESTFIDLFLILCAIFSIALFPRFSRPLAFTLISLNLLTVILQLVFLIPALSFSRTWQSWLGLDLSAVSVASVFGSLLPVVFHRHWSDVSPQLGHVRDFLESHSAAVVVCILLSLGAAKANIYGLIYVSSAFVLALYQLNSENAFLSRTALRGLTIFLLLAYLMQLVVRLWLPIADRLLMDQRKWQAYLALDAGSGVFWDFLALRVVMVLARPYEASQVVGDAVSSGNRQKIGSNSALRRICVGVWSFVGSIELFARETKQASMLTLVVVVSIVGLIHSQSQTRKRKRLVMLVWLMIGYIFFTWLNVLFRVPSFASDSSGADIVDACGLSESALVLVSVLGGLTTLLFSLNIQSQGQDTADAANRNRAGRFLFEQKVQLFLVKRREALMLDAMDKKLNRVVSKWASDSMSGGVSPASDRGGTWVGGALEDLQLEGHSQWEAERALVIAKGDGAGASEVLWLMRQFAKGSLEASWVVDHVRQLQWRLRTDDDDEDGERGLLLRSTTERLSLMVRDAGSGTWGWLSRWLDRSIQDEIFIQSPTEPLPSHRQGDVVAVKLAKWLVSAGQEWVLGCALVCFVISPCVARVGIILLAGSALFKSFPIPSKRLNQTLLMSGVVVLVVRLTLQLLGLRGYLGSDKLFNYWLVKLLDVRIDTADAVSGRIFGFLFADLAVILMVLLRRAVLVRLGIWDFVIDGKLTDEVDYLPATNLADFRIRRFASIEDIQFLATRAPVEAAPVADGAVGPAAGEEAASAKVEELLSHYRELRIEAQSQIEDLTKEKSPGRDLYVLLFVLSLALWFYVLFFYGYMKSPETAAITQLTAAEQYSVLDDIKEGRLSARMAVLLCLHVFYMVSDRLYYSFAIQDRISESTPAHAAEEGQGNRLHALQTQVLAFLQKGDYMRLTVLLAVFLYIQYWMLAEPNHQPALVIYYLAFGVYMGILLVQIRDGIPRSAADTLRPSITHVRAKQKIRMFLFDVYRGLPFLHELRTLIDWAVMETGLTMKQYFFLEDCHNVLFGVKHKMTGRRQDWPGKPKPFFWDKLCQGWALALILLIVLLGPLLMFSHLIPTDIAAPLVESNFRLNLVAGFCQDPTRIPLSCNFVSLRIYTANQLDIKAASGGGEQLVTFPQLSDKTFSQIRLKEILEPLRAKYSDIPGDKSDTVKAPAAVMLGVEVVHEYSRESPDPEGGRKQRIDGRAHTLICAYDNPVVSDPKCREDWESMKAILLELSGGPLASLPPEPEKHTHKGVPLEKLVPEVWTITRSGQEVRGRVLQKLSLRRFGDYVELSAEQQTPVDAKHYAISIKFNTHPVKSGSFLLKRGLVGMYGTVVFAVGRFFKGAFNGATFKIIYEEMPYPDDLIDIISGIGIAQHHCDLKREYELFSCLVRLLRSPETLIEMTGDRVTDYGLGNKSKPPFPELLQRAGRRLGPADLP